MVEAGARLGTTLGADRVGTTSTPWGREWPRLGRPSGRWFLGPILVGAAVVGAASTFAPLYALAALLLLGLIACVWRWPALGAFLIVGLTPLTAGINRGSAIPALRPNEAIVLIAGVALGARGIVGLRTGRLPQLRIGAVEASMRAAGGVQLGRPAAVDGGPPGADHLGRSAVRPRAVEVSRPVRDDPHERHHGSSRFSAACGSRLPRRALSPWSRSCSRWSLFGVPRFLATFFAPDGYTQRFSGAWQLDARAACGDRGSHGLQPGDRRCHVVA